MASQPDPGAVFDPLLARGRVEVVPLGRVLDLLEVTHAPDTVAAYRAEMAQGQRYPPIAVFPLLGRLVVTNGHKRLTAWRAFGGDTLPVEVWTVGDLLRDQLRQARRHFGGIARILLHAHADAEARRQGVAVARATAAHWVRIARSLARVIARALGFAPRT